MGEQIGLPTRKASQPLISPPFVASQPLELASGPQHEFTIDVPEGPVQRRFVEGTIIEHPPAYLRIEHPRQVVERFIAPQMQLPTTDDLTDPLRRLVADGRTEVDKVFPPPILRPPWAKRVAQEVESGDRILQTPVGIFAIDDLGLLRMESQSPGSKAPR